LWERDRVRGRYPTLPFEFPSHQGRGDKEGVIHRKGGERMKIKTVKTGKKEVKTLYCLFLVGG